MGARILKGPHLNYQLLLHDMRRTWTTFSPRCFCSQDDWANDDSRKLAKLSWHSAHVQSVQGTRAQMVSNT